VEIPPIKKIQTIHCLMGNFFRNWSEFPESNLILIGLDYSGKTTILHKTKMEEKPNSTIIGFNIESVGHKNININAWDIGGRMKIKKLERHYYQGANGLIFVIDSYDKERLPEIKDLIEQYSEEDELKDLPVLIFANKQDIAGCLNCSEIVDKLEIRNWKRNWQIQPCQAINNVGVSEGFDWILNQIKQNSLK
jgi:small GTP-binding protein